MELRSLLKVELHLYLDYSLSYKAVARLVEHLRREGIHLEVCLSSNVQIVPEIAG